MSHHGGQQCRVFQHAIYIGDLKKTTEEASPSSFAGKCNVCPQKATALAGNRGNNFSTCITSARLTVTPAGLSEGWWLSPSLWSRAPLALCCLVITRLVGQQQSQGREPLWNIAPTDCSCLSADLVKGLEQHWIQLFLKAWICLSYSMTSYSSTWLVGWAPCRVVGADDAWHEKCWGF